MAKNKRLLKPATVIARWNKLCQELKPKSPGLKKAKELAKLCGMRSMGEVECAADMDKRGIKYKYEDEILVYQHQPQKYTPDFTIVDTPNLLIEYKGKMKADVRKKILSVKRCNPNKRICLVFQRPNNKINKGSQTTYGMWADANDIDWSGKFIKDSWLK